MQNAKGNACTKNNERKIFTKNYIKDSQDTTIVFVNGKPANWKETFPQMGIIPNNRT